MTVSSTWQSKPALWPPQYESATGQQAEICDRNLEDDYCIIKSIQNHWRLQNEASILKRFQNTTPSLRPLLDEILEPVEPASIVLKYLDKDLLQESRRERLSRPDIKRVARTILLALKVLHKDGLVHTDVKLDNIFVNYGPQDQSRFSDIQLGDLGGVVHHDSDFAKEGHLIGAGISRSPEATFQLHWGTSTDIWSFGNAVSNSFLVSPCSGQFQTLHVYNIPEITI